MTATADKPVTGASLGTTRRAAAKVIARLRALGVIELAHVAGSARRGSDWCNDLDIVVVPTLERDHWGKPAPGHWSTEFVQAIVTGGSTTGGTLFSPEGGQRFDPLWRVAGSAHNTSRRFTLQSLRHASFKVELWTVSRESLGWMLMIRTGPKELGPALMRAARARGLYPRVQFCQEPIPGPNGGVRIASLPTERDVFNLLGVAWRPPTTQAREDLARELHAIADAAGIAADVLTTEDVL